MSKVICDICGTTYPATSEQCPICGYTRELSGMEASEELLTEQAQSAQPRRHVRGGRFSSSNVRKRNRNTATYQPQLTDDEDEEYHYEPKGESGSNKVLIAVLVVLILAILAVTAFIFCKFYLPNAMGDDTTEPVGESQEQQSSETTEPTIPCTGLTLTSGGSKELTQPGQYWLLNVEVTPADTTDKVIFTSSNESVATVTSEGRVEAVGEGEATISITCGTEQMDCFIVCVFEQETEPEETEPEETEPEETEPEETEPEPVTMTVSVERLSIRSGAGTDHEKIGTYLMGEKVEVYETVTVGDQNWGRTDKGWICIDYCS